MAERIGDIYLRKSPEVMTLTGFLVEVGGKENKRLVFEGDLSVPADCLFGPVIVDVARRQGQGDVFITTSVYIMEMAGPGRVRDLFVGGGVK